ncbi:MAG: hypothetical protein KDK23_16005, partial [Leptospiraceae bacterium]|nr:hypothetical protein [Leptospiraceae bacterium]
MGSAKWNIWRHAFTILLGAATASSYLSCAGNSNSATAVWPVSAKDYSIEVDARALQSSPLPGPTDYRGPGFEDCLTTIPSDYYPREHGLRLKICFEDQEFLNQLKNQWLALEGESRPIGPFQTSTHGSFLKGLRSKRIHFFYDGNGRQALENLASLHGRAKRSLLSRRFLNDAYVRGLRKEYADLKTQARKYPEFVYSFLLLEKELILLYPSSFRQRLHWLAIPLSERKFSRLKTRLFDIQSSLERLAGGGDGKDRKLQSEDTGSEAESYGRLMLRENLQECYDRRQIEFSCQGKTKVALETDDFDYSARIHCQQGSTILLERNPDHIISFIQDSEGKIAVPFVQEGKTLKWSRKVKQSGDRSKSTESAVAAFDYHGRHTKEDHSLATGNYRQGFWFIASCTDCNSLGFPEEKRSAKLPPCAVDDLVLEEVNTEGLLDASGQKKAGGKFLEWTVRRNCAPGALRLEIDGHPLILPAKELQSGIYLLVADASFFLPPEDVIWNELYLLRQLSANSHVRLVDRRGEQSRTYGSSPDSDQTEQKLSQKKVLYGRSPLSHPLRSVYSRVPIEQDFLLHPSRCQGLLRDFCRRHGMSPGYANPETRLPELTLDEVLPIGPAGHPRMEFLEWRVFASEAQEATAYLAAEMEIQLTSHRKQYRFTLPVPENVNGRFAVMGRREYCFAESAATLENRDFRIPNQPFTLKTTLVALRADGFLEERILGRHRFTGGFASHRSRIWADDWLMHAGTEDCRFASPGRPGYYRPRLQPAGMDEIDLHWYSSEPALATLRNLQTGAVGQTLLQPGKNPLTDAGTGKQARIPFLLEIQSLQTSSPLVKGGPNLSATTPE